MLHIFNNQPQGVRSQKSEDSIVLSAGWRIEQYLSHSLVFMVRGVNRELSQLLTPSYQLQTSATGRSF